MVKYKQKCMLCRKNYALISSRRQKPICYECHTKEFGKKIEDPEIEKLFDIDPELYKKSYFLRDIRARYHRFNSLTENQIEAFKKVVKDLENLKE